MFRIHPPKPEVVRLQGHVPAAIQSARALPRPASAGSQPVTVTVVLKRRDEAGFRSYLHDVYDPQAGQFHHFLTPDEIATRFGPAPQKYEDVLAYLRHYGFQLSQGSTNRLTITVRGTRAQAERAFGTRLRDFESKGRRFYANDQDPAVPKLLAENIQAVVGLSDLAVPKPAQLAAALVNALAVLNWELRAVSVAAPELVPVVTAEIEALLATADEAFWVAQSIGLEEFGTLTIIGGAAVAPYPMTRSKAPAPSKAPVPSKLSAHSKLQPRASSAGAGQKIGILAFSSINLQDVSDWLALTRKPASLINQVSQVAVNGGAPLGADETDVLMSVETLLTIVPGAQIVIYHAPKGSGTPSTSFQALFDAMIADHVTVISNSSSYCEDQTTAADAQSLDTILSTAAGAGISVFNATGDAGSGCSDGTPNTIAVPADSPNATAVGATSPTYGPAFTYGGETWLDGSGRTPPSGQSGYGLSRFFAKPSYQAALNSSTKRSVPDVVAPGDPKTGIAVCQADNGGCPTAQTFGGTSLSTPVWASFAALLNQAAGHSVGFLNPLLYPVANSNGFHSAASMGTDAAHVGLGSMNGDPLALALAHQSPGTPTAGNSTIQATSPNPFTPFVGTLPADGSSAAAIVVLLRDAAGNQVSGKTVTLTASAGSHAVITPLTTTSTTANGAAIFTVTDTTVEVVTFTAHDQTDGVTPTQTATVSFVGPAPTSAGISANPLTVPDNGVTTTTITVTLQGPNGVGTPGRRVELQQGSGHSLVNGPNPSLTDANGRIQFTASDSTAETVTYTAVDDTDGLNVPGSVQVTFTGTNQPPCGGVATAAAGFAVTSFATGFPIDFGCGGPVGIAFDNSGNVYISSFADGFINKFGLSGGVAGPTTRLNSTSLGAFCPAGLAFSKDLQHLYLAMQCNNTVVEISKTDGTILRTLGSVGLATGLATDPISGDLFASDVLVGAYRISNPESATPTVSLYANTGGIDGITFAPNGTLFAKGPGNEIISINGTNSGTPGAFTVVDNVPGPPDGVAVANSLTTPPTPLFLFVNGNNGVITKIDLTHNPVVQSTVATGGSRGDLIAVGPDGCFYATQSDRVLKVTNADGSCPFSPTTAATGLLLAPTTVTPNPAQGTPVTFTATFSNVAVPANTPVVFQVLGPNIRSFLAKTNANGQATFTYTGAFTGTDVVVATATVGNTTLTSNLGNAVWVAGAHTTSCDLDQSTKNGDVGFPNVVTGSLFDVSVIPPVAIPGANLALAVGGQSCSSTTNGAGLAQCSVLLNTPGLLPLSGTFTGSSQFLGTTCKSSFAALNALTTPSSPQPTAAVPVLSLPGLVGFAILLTALGAFVQRRIRAN